MVVWFDLVKFVILDCPVVRFGILDCPMVRFGLVKFVIRD